MSASALVAPPARPSTSPTSAQSALRYQSVWTTAKYCRRLPPASVPWVTVTTWHPSLGPNNCCQAVRGSEAVRAEREGESRRPADHGGAERGRQSPPVIDRTYPLVETPEVLRYLERGHPGGKVVITI